MDLSVDNATNIKGSDLGVILGEPDGVLIEQSLRLSFKVTNHQVEYEALKEGMLLVKEMGVQSLIAKSDS